MRLLLSCISTKHSVLKQHWTNTSQETPAACPLTVLGSYEKPKEDLGGLLCLIEDMGCSQQTIGLHMAAGMVASEKGVFVTSFGSVHEVDGNLCWKALIIHTLCACWTRNTLRWRIPFMVRLCWRESTKLGDASRKK